MKNTSVNFHIKTVSIYGATCRCYHKCDVNADADADAEAWVSTIAKSSDIVTHIQ